MSVKNFFAVQDTDSQLRTKTGGVFGLNAAVNISELVFKAENKAGEPSPHVVITVQVGEKNFMAFLFLNKGGKLFFKGEQIGPENENYEEVFFTDMAQKIAVIKHALKAVGVTQQQIDNVVATLDPEALVEGVQTLLALVPADYKTRPVDAFLQYQYNIQGDNERTFLELPNNMKGGYFLVPSVKPVGKWTEVRTEEGLHYIDDAGNKHVLDRTKSYMESNRAKEQTTKDQAANVGGVGSTAAQPAAAKKGNWG